MTNTRFAYDASTRTLTPTTTDCVSCDENGTQPTRVPCPTCKGTGSGPRGGRGKCRKCYGNGNACDHDHRVTCAQCGGSNTKPATMYDSVRSEMLAALCDEITWRVVRSARGQTWSEAHLGLGCIVSVTDYGAHETMTDDDLITKVREGMSYTQACKIADTKTGRLADFIVIDCSRNGYSVRAYWGEARRMANASDYFADGMAVFNAGGNGTLAAGMLDNASTVPLDDTEEIAP